VCFRKPKSRIPKKYHKTHKKHAKFGAPYIYICEQKYKVWARSVHCHYVKEPQNHQKMMTKKSRTHTHTQTLICHFLNGMGSLWGKEEFHLVQRELVSRQAQRVGIWNCRRRGSNQLPPNFWTFLIACMVGQGLLLLSWDQ